MSITIFAPGKYRQGINIFDKLGVYTRSYTTFGVLILMDQYAYQDLKKQTEDQFKKEGIRKVIKPFSGECCREEIDKLKALIKEEQLDVVIGIGGGKVIDVAKAVAHFGGYSLIVVPTTASTDGPCSSLSVLYEKDGTFKEYLYLTSSPDLVLVDTAIILKAPVRLLAAGMGDALSTHFETAACYDGQVEKYGKSDISITAMQLSRACMETILTYGLQAKKDVETGMGSEALEKVVEAIIYLSCIGFESGGLAAAHSVANALTCVPQGVKYLHGEKVAFGTLVQIILENLDKELIVRLRDFYRVLNLPISLKDMDIQEGEDVNKIVKEACKPEQPIHNMRDLFNDKERLENAMYATNDMFI